MFFSLNIPFEKHEVDDYERKRFRGLDQKIVHWREERILRRILKEVSTDSGWALDVPCGYGRFSGLFVQKGLCLVNSDLSFHMVKRARERSQYRGLPFAVVADLKQGLPFKQGVFHLVFSIRFFHHLHKEEEREAILREFSRLEPKWVILSYYKRNWLHSLQRKLRRWVKKSKTQIKMITSSQLEREAQAAGFRIVRTFPLFKGIHAQQIALLQKS